MRIIEHFFRLLAPDECLVCRAEGSLLCDICVVGCLESIPERCYRCYRATELSRTCPLCRHHSVLKYVWVRTGYTESAKEIVHELKFNYARSAAKVIASEISTHLPVHEANIIVHIPAASSHVRQRGFDQSALVARELSALLHIPHINGLARKGQARQVGSSSILRRQQMKGVFRPLSLHTIKGANVLLIDDVLTTGSTIESAALALRVAGAKSVSAAVFAQAN